jgi:hypothetical protein
MWESIWNLILPNLLEFILAAISLVISRYIIPCIKNDFIPWFKEKRIYNVVKNFVQAVEKMAESGVIEKVDKKNKVVELLTKKGVVVDEIVDTFIESCVKELDMATSVIVEEIKKD